MTETSGINVTDVAFVRFAAPDLDLMEQYFIDFGMQRSQRTDTALYMRGTDDEGFVHVTELADEPKFIGLAFTADSFADLQQLAQHPDFGDLHDLAGPGGGHAVKATDPNGFEVEVIAGRSSVGKLDSAQRATRNDTIDQPRRGAAVRLEPGPSHVRRLGHVVIEVQDFRATEAWYKNHFGLITSDEIALDETRSLGAFMRCNRGGSHVDHHTLFCLQGKRAAFNHAAFEVANLDDLMTGHSHLQATERQHQWGVGRHILGSQIYDYWLDPYGHMVEHWTDGDLFNDQTPPNIASIDHLIASQWGPTMGGPPR